MKEPQTQSEVVQFLLANAARLDDEHFFSLMAKLDQWKLGRKKDMALSDAYEILKQNVRHESSTGEGFVYLSQVRELIEAKPKYNQELINKVHNREAVIEVDDFTIIKDLINFMYPDDPYLEDEFPKLRLNYFSIENPFFNDKLREVYQKHYWGSNFSGHEEVETKPRIKASEFILK